MPGWAWNWKFVKQRVASCKLWTATACESHKSALTGELLPVFIFIRRFLSCFDAALYAISLKCLVFEYKASGWCEVRKTIRKLSANMTINGTWWVADDDRRLGSLVAPAVDLLAFPRERWDSFLWRRGRGSDSETAKPCKSNSDY